MIRFKDDPAAGLLVLLGAHLAGLTRPTAVGALAAPAAAIAHGSDIVQSATSGAGGHVAVGRRIAAGDVVAGYEIGALVGRGGMGDVYRAFDSRLERPVALKLLGERLSDDEGFRERMLTESRLAAGLDHPNVVPIYEAGEADGRLFIAMRYVEGTDLKALLRREGALAPGRAVAIASQVADALDAAHAKGLVHRDVKPSNVLLDQQRRPRARLPGRLRPHPERLGHPADRWPPDGHGRLRRAGADPSATTSTAAPTSTRSAACSSSP